MNRNIAPKIVSILSALVLWIYVMGTLNPTEYRNFPNIPVRLINVEELREQNLAIKGDTDFKVRVKLTGRRNEVSEAAEQFQVSADLRGYGAGINNIPIEITVPNNVETDITPRFVRIELERIINEQKEVKVLTSGTPKNNFIVGELTYKPTTVWVEGAESYVNLVKNVIAQLDITEKSRNIALRLPLKPVNDKNEEITNVNMEVSHVDISLSVDLLKSVSVKPDLQITTEAGYIITNVEVSPANVVLRGQKELIDGVTEIITEPIKFEDLNQNKTLNVKLGLPEGITLHNDTPIVVSLYLAKLEEATYKVGKDKIIFSNINEELEVDIGDVPEDINVRIVAPRNVLDSIKEDDIKILVDLNGLGADKYTIEPAAQLPFTLEQDVRELHLAPKTIDIKLVEK
ncbi:MAG TPA: CdaR family protein [Clostridia bacterium]|nr:CdaR family protein [Clostridia bacterium]